MPPRYSLKVLDGDTGAPVVDDLPHPHRGSLQLRGLQRGSSAMTALSTASFPLYSPRSDQWRDVVGLYRQLAPLQRLEVYDTQLPAGSAPRYSFQIQSIPQSLKGEWSIECIDSLVWLAGSPMVPGEVFGGTPDTIVANLLGTIEVAKDDDFSSGSIASYTPSTGGTFSVGTDPWDGTPNTVIATATGPVYLLSGPDNLASDYYQPCWISADAHLIAGTDATNAGSFGVIAASDSGGANCRIGSCVLRWNGASSTVLIDGYIITRSGGVETIRASATSILQDATTNSIYISLDLVGYFASGVYFWKLFINGTLACTWSEVIGGGNPNGRVGLRWVAAAGGSPSMYCRGLWWRFRNWTLNQRFKNGTISAAQPQQTVTGANQSQMDILTQLAVIASYDLRKNAQAGFKADTIDFGAVGIDYSDGRIVLDEDNGDFEDIQSTANAESLARTTRVLATPGSNGLGSYVYRPAQATGTAVVLDNVATVGPSDYAAIRRYGNAIGSRKATPQQAKAAIIRWQPGYIDALRELDYVGIRSRTLGIDNTAPARVVGIDLSETSELMTLYLDQYAVNLAGFRGDRLSDNVAQIAATFKTR